MIEVISFIGAMGIFCCTAILFNIAIDEFNERSYVECALSLMSVILMVIVLIVFVLNYEMLF